MYNGLPDTQTMHLIGDLENGKVVTIFFSKTRPERRTLAIKQMTSQLVWIRAQGVRPEGASESSYFSLFSDFIQFQHNI